MRQQLFTLAFIICQPSFIEHVSPFISVTTVLSQSILLLFVLTLGGMIIDAVALFTELVPLLFPIAFLRKTVLPGVCACAVLVVSWSTRLIETLLIRIHSLGLSQSQYSHECQFVAASPLWWS